MTRRRWLLIMAGLLLVLGAYAGYDWQRPCTGGPLKQFVKAVANDGSYTVRCAG